MLKQKEHKIRLTALILLIICYFYAPYYDFLILNSVLAYIPIEIGFYLKKNNKLRSVSFNLVFFFWLILIPNTFYLLTDLNYLTNLKIFNSIKEGGGIKKPKFYGGTIQF